MYTTNSLSLIDPRIIEAFDDDRKKFSKSMGNILGFDLTSEENGEAVDALHYMLWLGPTRPHRKGIKNRYTTAYVDYLVGILWSSINVKRSKTLFEAIS